MKPVIGSHYDPTKRPKLDQDAELIQRALNPSCNIRGPIHMPRWSLDGVIYTAVVMAAVTLIVVWLGSIFN